MYAFRVPALLCNKNVCPFVTDVLDWFLISKKPIISSSTAFALRSAVHTSLEFHPLFSNLTFSVSEPILSHIQYYRLYRLQASEGSLKNVWSRKRRSPCRIEISKRRLKRSVLFPLSLGLVNVINHIKVMLFIPFTISSPVLIHKFQHRSCTGWSYMLPYSFIK